MNLASNFESPILRLSSDIWSQISYFLASGDVIRLSSTGSALASRVVAGTHRLCLEWTIPRFMDFDDVFAAASRYSHIKELIFYSNLPYRLYWTPLNVAMLPRTIVSLELSFLRCISLLTYAYPLSAVLPGLQSLTLRDTSTKVSESYYVMDFRNLPPSLLKLCFASRHSCYTVFDHWSCLPSGLQELSLKLPIHVSSQAEFGNQIKGFPMPYRDTGAKVHLPKLPESLTTLAIDSAFPEELHVDCAELPTTLTKLKLKEAFKFGSFSTTEMSTIDITQMKVRQPHLRVLYLDNSSLDVQDAIKLIPLSVTKLKAVLNGAITSVSQDDLKSLVRKLKQLNRNHTDLDQFMFGGQEIELPHLTRLFLGGYSGALVTHIPPSVTLLNDPPRLDCKLPDELKTLFLSIGFKGFPTLPLGLETLHLTQQRCITVEQLHQLPSSLQALYSTFSEESWLQLLDLIRQGRLPNLTRINSRAVLPTHLFSDLPDQLQHLEFLLTPTSTEAAVPNFGAGFARSKLLSIGVFLQEIGGDQVVQLLESFPSTLTSLRFIWMPAVGYTPTIGARQLSKLPPNLSKLILVYHLPSSSATAASDPIFSAVSFPASLESIDLHSVLVDPSQLPPNLSKLNSKSIVLREIHAPLTSVRGLITRKLVDFKQ